MEVPNMMTDSIESFLAICRAFEKKPSEVLGSIDF
jgi:hypothetical protein